MTALPIRLKRAAKAALFHLLGSLFVALAGAVLVFGLWYPQPYSELAGGRSLFLLLVTVDVICGPLLTLIVYSPHKPADTLWRDIGVVVLLQLSALAYGLHTMMEARPVFLAYEGDRFRVVVVPDVQKDQLDQARPELQRLSLTGPRTIGVKLATGNDADYMSSLQLSMRGLHPAFRPARWVPYESQVTEVAAAAKPLADLRQKHKDQQALIDGLVAQSEVPEARLGYLPLVAPRTDEWVVIVDRTTAQPKGFAALSGW
jgi:hypothetical protein